VQGTEIGLWLATENWLDLSSELSLSVDASYGTALQEYYALSRVGFRVRPRLALGLEGGALGNEEYNAGMGGGFVRLNLRDTAFTLSSGVHRQLSRRSSKRLRRSRRLSHVLSCLEGHSSCLKAKSHCRPRSGSAWPFSAAAHHHSD
jgi:hypothetical protein